MQRFSVLQGSLNSTTRSMSNSLTKTINKPLKSKFSQYSSHEELKTSISKKKPVVDYLSMISPKRDSFDTQVTIETKDVILDMHKIKEIILIQEQKRRVNTR